jgi:hypothetical protein
MEKTKIEIESSLAINGVSLIAVTRVSLNHGCVNGVVSFSGIRRPIAIVAILPSVKKAFRITGEEIPLDQLVQEVPSVKEALEAR